MDSTTSSGSSRPRVLIIATAFSPAVSAGGPARSLTNLVSELEGRYEVVVVAPNRDLGSTTRFPDIPTTRHISPSTRIEYIDPRYTWHVVRALRREARIDWDLMLINSFWSPRFALLPATMRWLGLLRTGQFVLMPRGELEAGAIAIKARKKRIALHIYRYIYIRAIDAFGVTSVDEAANVGQFIPHRRTYLTDNTPDEIPYDESYRISGPPDQALHILSLGRVNEKKGVLELIRGLRLVTVPSHLTIAGPQDGHAYWQACIEEASRLPSHVTVDVVGPVSREQIPQLLHEHDFMVTLTAGENFGHTLAEALQAGCPVLATRSTPWTQYLEDDGSRLISDRTDPEVVAEAIEELGRTCKNDRVKSRRAARASFESWLRNRRSNVVDLAFAEIQPTSYSTERISRDH